MMPTWIRRLAAPKYCYCFLVRLQPVAAFLCLLCLLYGLWGGLIVSPPDYQQGNVFRIIYLHVPLAVWSLGVYVVMALAALSFLVWHLKVADLLARVCASIGAVFTILTLVTGSIWGKPTWGTWWIWDARLTSEAILFFIYLSIILIRYALPEQRLAARASSMVVLLGAVNIPIVHYSVDWWHTLHQGATILKWGKPSISTIMFDPLLSMILACGFYFVWYVCIAMRYRLLQSEQQSQWVLNTL